jgi:hypothetical protein
MTHGAIVKIRRHAKSALEYFINQYLMRFCAVRYPVMAASPLQSRPS